MSILRSLFDLIFPERCVGCRSRETSLCDTCLSLVPPPRENPETWIHAVFSYKDPRIKKAVWLLKYKNRKRLAQTFGNALADLVLEDIAENIQFERAAHIVLVPIPISRSRLRERGYNQAYLIAAALKNRLGDARISIENNLLKKEIDTKRQSHTKSRRERLENIVGSFSGIKAYNPRAIYILIDDVTTTGATLLEAKKILRAGGARKIKAYTVAH